MTVKDLKGRVWAFVLYPDSCIDYIDMINYLDRLRIPMAISPLHQPKKNNDKDENEEKKDHYHVIMYFDGQKQYKDLQKLMDFGTSSLNRQYFNWELLVDKKNINGKKAKYPHFVKVNSLSSYFRYLIHLDQPKKQQFKGYKLVNFVVDDLEKLNSIVLLNGFNEKDYMTRCSTSASEQLLDLVEDYSFNDIKELMRYLVKTKNHFLENYISKNMFYVKNFLCPDLFGYHFDKEKERNIERSLTTTKATDNH